VLSNARRRALLSPDCRLTEAQLERLRQDLYALSQIAIAAVQAVKLDLNKLVQIERQLATTLECLKQPRLAGTIETRIAAPATPQIGTVAQLSSMEPESSRRFLVKPLLDKRGWSINDWAVQSGVDFHTADRYLKGQGKPYPSTRLKLANSLNINVEALPS
jgi:hypothetical protein